MAKDKKKSTGTKEKNLVTTPRFRMDFANLHEAIKADGKEKAMYNLTMIFPKNANLKKLEKLVEATIEDAFPNPKKRPDIESPLKVADKKRKEKYPQYKNAIYARADSGFKPQVVDAEKDIIDDPEEIYSGCYGYARVGAYLWEYKGKYGVKFNLYAVQKAADCEDDERFVQTVDHSEYFEDVSDDDDDDTDDDDDDTPKKSKNKKKSKSRDDDDDDEDDEDDDDDSDDDDDDDDED